MESKIDCDFCEKSPEIDYVPKTLQCGHSICSSCLQEVFDLKKLCPKCDGYSQTHKFASRGFVQDMLKTCINIVEISLSTLKSIRKTGNENYDKEVLEDNIEKLQEILKSYQIVGFEYFTETNISLDDNYENQKNLYPMVNPKPTKYMLLDGFKSRDYFILEINRLLKEKEIVYVCDLMYEMDSENGHFYRWKYGKFDSTKDCIDIHCLSIYSVEENAACVRLQDLKRCLEFHDYRPFIDFGSGKMFFTLINSSALTLQFLKLCTGENGQMLKGSTPMFNCGKDAAKEIENLPDIGSELNDAELACCYFNWVTIKYHHKTEYDISDHLNDKGTTFSKDDVIIQIYENRIYVRKVIDESYLYKNVVAKLVTNSDIKDLNDLKDSKIEDCGISMNWFV